MAKYFFYILFFLLCTNAKGQLGVKDSNNLANLEIDLQTEALQIVSGRDADARIVADSMFTRKFVNALKTPYSFYYPFDSLQAVSILESDDHKFRIFTWQLFVDENNTRYHGAIQMNTPDGSLKLFPLIDRAKSSAAEDDSVVTNLSWVGALYYNMVQVQNGRDTYYTLIGIDDRSFRSTRKVIDILSFKSGLPKFGMNLFDFSGSPDPPENKNRFFMTYKKFAGARMNFDKELNMIIVEHLTSETNEPGKKYTYIPDGDYEGFRWKNGKWVYVDRVFTDRTPGNLAPLSNPLYDKDGNIIEANLKKRDN